VRAIYDGIWLMPVAVIDYGNAKPISQAIETWLQKNGMAIHADGLSQSVHDRHEKVFKPVFLPLECKTQSPKLAVVASGVAAGLAGEAGRGAVCASALPANTAKKRKTMVWVNRTTFPQLLVLLLS
jgi:hypothetical protein